VLLAPISEEEKARLLNAIHNQRRPTVTVLSSLLAAQDELGYIPDEAVEEVAVLNDTTINEVWGVASFYTNFRFTPPGRHNVEICWGPTCHLMGAGQILERVMGQLELEGEGETIDDNISFKFNTCLGACSNAPVMSIDHHLIGRLTPDSASEKVRRVQIA
jgi:NADH-quinone oxidoreductase subunit E